MMYHTIAILMAALLIKTGYSYHRVCYYTNWSQYRPSPMTFFPENINPSLCSHLVYAFAKIDINNHIAPYEWNDESTEWSDGLYDRFNDIKMQHAHIKTLLAVGGWNFGTTQMTLMLASRSSRSEFITSAIQLLRKYRFDGIDLDFEYPGSRGSPPEDKYKFTTLCQEFRIAFDREAMTTNQPVLLLTMAVAAGKDNIDAGYEIPELSRLVDFVSLMAYDLHGAWEQHTGHNAPLFPSRDEVPPGTQLNVKWAAEYWLNSGMDATKLILGMPVYGRGFTLSDPRSSAFGDPARGPCNRGRFTREPGILSYYEICDILSSPGADIRWHEEHKVPYVVLRDQWVGYDDQESLTDKVNWMKSKGLAGWMMWSLDFDDFNGQFCHHGNYPLLHTLNDVLFNNHSRVSTTTFTTESHGTTLGTSSTPTSHGTTLGTSSTPTSHGTTLGTSSTPTSITQEYLTSTRPETEFLPSIRVTTELSDTTSAHTSATATQTSSSRVTTSPILQTLISTAPATVSTLPPSKAATSTHPPSTAATSTHSPSTAATSTHLPSTAATSTHPPSTAATSTHPPSAAATSTHPPSTAATSTHPPSTTTTSKPNDITSLCMNLLDGHYQHPTDCHKFIHCSHKRTFEKRCPATLMFNPRINVCDWPRSVQGIYC